MWRDWDTGEWIIAVIGAAGFWLLVLFTVVAVARGEWMTHRLHRRREGRPPARRHPHPR